MKERYDNQTLHITGEIPHGTWVSLDVVNDHLVDANSPDLVARRALNREIVKDPVFKRGYDKRSRKSFDR